MNLKTKVKIMVDIAMSIVLFVYITYQFVEPENHEIAGAVMLFIFILHHVLNVKWFTALTKSNYTAQRLFLTIVDFALLLTMVLLMVSGIRMSRTVFRFIDFSVIGMETARSMHMVTSYLGFLLTGVHIGLHFGMVQGMTRKMFKLQSTSKRRTWTLRVIDFAFVLYGLYALIKRQFLSYITLQMHFVFFDYNEPVIFYVIDLFAILILMGSLGYYLQKIFKFSQSLIKSL